eukprot:1156309-Pelagomonas_calceolata.AAC.7
MPAGLQLNGSCSGPFGKRHADSGEAIPYLMLERAWLDDSCMQANYVTTEGLLWGDHRSRHVAITTREDLTIKLKPTEINKTHKPITPTTLLASFTPAKAKNNPQTSHTYCLVGFLHAAQGLALHMLRHQQPHALLAHGGELERLHGQVAQRHMLHRSMGEEQVTTQGGIGNRTREHGTLPSVLKHSNSLSVGNHGLGNRGRSWEKEALCAHDCGFVCISGERMGVH